MNGANIKPDYTKAKSRPEMIFQGNTYRITILTERLVRLEYNQNGVFFDALTEQVINRLFPPVEIKVTQDERKLEIETKYFRLKYLKEKPFEGYNLEVILLNANKSWTPNNKEVRNFKTSGRGFINNNLEYVNGLYSGDGFASLDDSHSMAINPEGYLLPVNYHYDKYLFMYRKDFGFCLRDYFLLTGYPTMLPRYSFGIWWNKSGKYSSVDIEKLVYNFNKYEIPLSVILLDDNWHLKDVNHPEKYKTGFTFNKKLIPNPNALINFLKEKNIHLGLQIDPSEGIMPHEEAYDKISRDLQINLKNTIPFNVFETNSLREYFVSLINPLKQIGVEFFWLDYTKPTNIEAKRALINYQFKFEKLDTNKRPFLVSDNPLIAPHRYSILLSGKNKVSWDTLSNLPFYTALGANKGISWWSHDIGGYEQGIEEAELYVRYVQFGCFSPIFRLSSKEGKYYKREPWLWDVRTRSIVKNYTRLRQQLIPYLYSENYKYYKTGLPLIQPVYYVNPEIFDEPRYKNEYTFGTELLVAPILNRKDYIMNRAIQHLFLPEGMWYEFNTGKKFPGNKRYVTFYKDQDYPVFAKSGSIIPLQVLDDNLNDISLPKTLEIHIFPGKSNIYKLYEDDGISNNYLNGDYIITAIDYNYLQNNYTVIIRPLEGKSGIIPDFRNYKIRFRNTRMADDVIVYLDGNVINKKSYTDDNDFVVEVNNVNTTSQLTINCKGKNIEIDAVRLINEEIDSIISDLPIETKMKEKLASILFSDASISKKRINLRKLKKKGLDIHFIKMFIRILEYNQ